VGSSISLGNTFSVYYSLSTLKREANGSIIIYRALLKHGYSNFSLDIIEYCEPSLLIKREQYYIDILKPEYNIKVASSKIGSKQIENKENNKCDNNLFNNGSNMALNPDFVTGLTDAEGCFSISFTKRDKTNYKEGIKLTFIIKMLKNEIELLTKVKSFFGCGTLYHNKDGSIDFKTQDFNSLKYKVIPHFLKYPLRGTKYLDFISFKEAFDIIENREHLKEGGLNKLYIIKKGMNNNRLFALDTYYSPNHTQKESINYIPINGHYVNGFIVGDGCLSLHMGKHFGSMHLQISQHKNNKLLMIDIANYFASPSKVYLQGSNCLQINLGGIKLWENIIFKHFDKYPLHGRKTLILKKLFLIRELKKDNKHIIRIGRSSQ
jgi:group I intron endonuclease